PERRPRCPEPYPPPPPKPPEPRPAERRQISWGDLLRTGQTLKRALDGDLSVAPDRDLPWTRVELNAAAAPVLTRAHDGSPAQILGGAWIEVRLEHSRVLVDGIEVGTIPGTVTATVPGRVERQRPGAPYVLEIQLP